MIDVLGLDRGLWLRLITAANEQSLEHDSRECTLLVPGETGGTQK